MVRTFQLVSVFDSLSVLENLVIAVTRSGPDSVFQARFSCGRVPGRRRIREACQASLDGWASWTKAQVDTR